MECMSLRESGDELKKFDIAYFGASCDAPEKNKQFAEKLKLEFPLLSDPDRKVAEAYGILHRSRKFSSRATIYVDKAGKIAHIQRKVNVRKHGEEIVTQMKALGFPLKTVAKTGGAEKESDSKSEKKSK